ncbi:nitrilase-related carbon-nitrogen hydrolase [Hymenobacter crusticola]|uniref:CN hydrolase domain-containing protein n=1 Tax=Hymenobacter crusticola TaxID=1770526 RepID=A0A243W6Q0_9BACT|nr:nitrilase-related carbon-nitrogen hydrolase [Hymenobacter crusticola]OUJ67985.1 hypothetical protein BXP70_28320 [Hymenobacter crusticola]
MRPSPPAPPSLLLPLAAALLAGLALWPAVGLHPLWWWAWLAPVPLLCLAYGAGTHQARGLTMLAAGIGVSVNAPYFALLMPLPAVGLTLVAQTLAWVFVVGASRRLVVRYQAWWTVLAYPVLWTGLDTLEAAVLPDGNWGSLAYAQVAFLPALQLTSVLGVAGLLFVVALVPATLALALTYGRQLRQGWRAYLLTGLVTGGTLAYGTSRLQNAPAPSGPATTFGLVAIDEGISARTPAVTRATIEQQYARHVAALAAQGAQVIVLPEKIASLPPAQALALQRQLSHLAARQHVWLASGVVEETAPAGRNLLWLFAPTGARVATYQKHYLAPPERGLAVGQAYQVRQVAGATTGLAICKDMHFAALGRAYGQRQVAAMLVPAWDFGADRYLAAGMTAVRGVENGYLVVRASRDGLLTVSDAYGRCLGEQVSAPLPGRTLLVRARVGPPLATAYTHLGNGLGWLCVAGGVGLLLLGRRARRPVPSIGSQPAD